MGFSS
jgi:hypothetical protein